MSSDNVANADEPSIFNFMLGLAVSLGASIMNAAGLNLLNLDHIKNSRLSTEKQRNECGRPLWHLGLYLYIASQLVGSTIALYFLKAQWVAPLGSVSLIFNFVFARAFVGTRITRKDIIGTFVIIGSVVWIVVLCGMNSGGDDNLTLESLKELFIRPLFILYFSILDFFTFLLFGAALYCYLIAKKERRKEHNRLLQGIKTKRLKKVIGMTMAGVGGLIASQTLLLAKSGVKLLSKSLTGDNQFTDRLSWFILVGLGITAVLQIYALNTALKLHDSVLVVPIFYGFYTAMGLINSMIYLNELNTYAPWTLFLVILGIGVLVYGVLLLSESKETPGEQLEDAHEMQKNESTLTANTWDGTTIGGESSIGSETVRLRKDSAGNNQQISIPHAIVDGDVSDDDETSRDTYQRSKTTSDYNMIQFDSLDDIVFPSGSLSLSPLEYGEKESAATELRSSDNLLLMSRNNDDHEKS